MKHMRHHTADCARSGLCTRQGASAIVGAFSAVALAVAASGVTAPTCEVTEWSILLMFHRQLLIGASCCAASMRKSKVEQPLPAGSRVHSLGQLVHLRTSSSAASADAGRA